MGKKCITDNCNNKYKQNSKIIKSSFTKTKKLGLLKKR